MFVEKRAFGLMWGMIAPRVWVLWMEGRDWFEGEVMRVGMVCGGDWLVYFVCWRMCIDDGKWGTVVIWGRIVVCPFARGGQML
jgi:hypothetical protein